MKSWRKYLIIFVCMFAAIGYIYVKPCKAASAEVTISAESAQVTEGNKFFVYITINSETEFSNFETSIVYDDEILEYLGGASVITGDSGFLRISDMNVVDGDTSRKYTLEFKALKVGHSDISFADRAYVYDSLSGNEMSVSSSNLTVNIKAPVTASDNARLKSLNISPSEMVPAFEAGITEYSTAVSSDVQQLVITALPEDPKASISISGNDLLKEGENKVIVSVLAESGNVIEYNIKVTKEAGTGDPSEEAPVTPLPEHRSFEVTNQDGIKYAVYNGKYMLLEPEDTVEIPEGYKQGRLILSGVTVTAYIPEKNEASEFILLYAQNEYGEAGFYLYDRIEKTMQRYVPESLVINQEGNTGEDADTLTEEYNANLTKAAIVIALLAAFSVLMTIVAIHLALKKKRHKRSK